jgi:hypothetical protein
MGNQNKPSPITWKQLGQLSLNVIPTGDQTGTEGVFHGNDEYHEVWRVRKYDLENIREDMNRLESKGGWYVPVGSVCAGVSATGIATGILEITGRPEGSFDLRFGFVGTGVFTGILAIVLFAVDRRFSKRAGADLETIKGRLDKLISMFHHEE